MEKMKQKKNVETIQKSQFVYKSQIQPLEKQITRTLNSNTTLLTEDAAGLVSTQNCGWRFWSAEKKAKKSVFISSVKCTGSVVCGNMWLQLEVTGTQISVGRSITYCCDEIGLKICVYLRICFYLKICVVHLRIRCSLRSCHRSTGSSCRLFYKSLGAPVNGGSNLSFIILKFWQEMSHFTNVVSGDCSNTQILHAIRRFAYFLA